MLSAAPASWLRVQNLAFTDAHVSAISDWDSVTLVPEPALVGASAVHPIDGRLERPDPLPTLAQLVADYDEVRGAPFNDHEHVLAVGERWIASYAPAASTPATYTLPPSVSGRPRAASHRGNGRTIRATGLDAAVYGRAGFSSVRTRP
jgi:hypothetical protein